MKCIAPQGFEAEAGFGAAEAAGDGGRPQGNYGPPEGLAAEHLIGQESADGRDGDQDDQRHDG